MIRHEYLHQIFSFASRVISALGKSLVPRRSSKVNHVDQDQAPFVFVDSTKQILGGIIDLGIFENLFNLFFTLKIGIKGTDSTKFCPGGSRNLATGDRFEPRLEPRTSITTGSLSYKICSLKDLYSNHSNVSGGTMTLASSRVNRSNVCPGLAHLLSLNLSQWTGIEHGPVSMIHVLSTSINDFQLTRVYLSITLSILFILFSVFPQF
jgi:hypothetical protein